MKSLTTRDELAAQYLQTHSLATQGVKLLQAELAKPNDDRDRDLIVKLTSVLKAANEALGALTRALNTVDTYSPPAADAITFAHPTGVFAQPVDREAIRLQAEQQLQQQAAELSRQARGDDTALAADRALPTVQVSQ